MKLANYANVLKEMSIELDIKCRPKAVNFGDKDFTDHTFIMD
jgi:hypothetical protein